MPDCPLHDPFIFPVRLVIGGRASDRQAATIAVDTARTVNSEDWHFAEGPSAVVLVSSQGTNGRNGGGEFRESRQKKKSESERQWKRLPCALQASRGVGGDFFGLSSCRHPIAKVTFFLSFRFLDERKSWGGGEKSHWTRRKHKTSASSWRIVQSA